MARRQAVQLQADLQTDEDFDRFIELTGLCVIDVYTDWCGPCSGMLGTLRKIKLEAGGDLINLAIARSDTISYISRFYKKSEPTWLFINQGRAINIMFGVNCPKLVKLVNDELKLLGKLRERQTYSVSEMQPKEVERDSLKNAAKRAKAQKEQAEKEQKKKDYFQYVTNAIHENLHDIGITIFGPHVHRDTYRHLMDYGAEKFGIQCKDRRNQVITKEQFEVINTACENPLSAEVIDAIDDKELFICYWKVLDDLKESAADVLQKYADDIVKVHKNPQDEEETLPPLVVDARVKVALELAADEECPEDDQPTSPKESKIHAVASRESARQEASYAAPENATEIEEGDDNEERNKGEDAAEELKQTSGLELDRVESTEFLDKLEEARGSNEDKPKKNACHKTITIPAVWVPKDWRTHAALIYVLFRAQTSSFLPPDPVPEPPHVIMAFDTYKKRDLLEFAERNTKDIPLYGFFTSDEADEAKFIASSKTNYAHHRPAASDKLVFKVNKCTSHTMLSLVTYGPTYVSPNTTIGAQEAKIFFPDDYVSAEAEMLAALVNKGNKSRGGKGGKAIARGSKDSSIYEHLQAEAEAEAAAVVAGDGEEPVADAALAGEGVDAQTKQAETEVKAVDQGIEGEGEGEGIEVPAGEATEVTVVEIVEVPEVVNTETHQGTQQEQQPETAGDSPPEAPQPGEATQPTEAPQPGAATQPTEPTEATEVAAGSPIVEASA